MNDQDFLNRLWANPKDSSTEFIAAIRESADRHLLWQSAQTFEDTLHRVLKAPSPSATLQTKLLAISSPADTVLSRANKAPSLWQRALPLAACLALFLTLAARYQPIANNQVSQQILEHVYAEGQFLDSTDNVSLAAVNNRMEAAIGAQLMASAATEQLQVHFAKDCWIAKAVAMHLIISGERGPVSLMMIPKSVITKEISIADDRFNGFMTPVAGGTLVVLGTPKEPIRKYLDLLNSNMKWEY